MKTVKEVARLSGVSVRTLQYYDEIGVFKPTAVTGAGYRLYDDEACETLQQILFFKELNFPLKDIKLIMANPDFDKIEAFKKQRVLLQVKRDRLNRLLDLLDRLEKGEANMSFKEFDLSEYIQALERFKEENEEEISRQWGSLEKYEKILQSVKDHESDIAKNAVKYYGSVEKYVDAMKNNMSHFSELMEKMEKMKEEGMPGKHAELMERLTTDLSKDVKSGEIQSIVRELMALPGGKDNPIGNMGEKYWEIMVEEYLHNPQVVGITDEKYGPGAARFIGEAVQYYLNEQ